MEEQEEKTYKTPVLFMRKSVAGEHLYAFNRDAEDAEGTILGEGVGSILLNISEIVKLIDDKIDWIKVSVMAPREDLEEA